MKKGSIGILVILKSGIENGRISMWPHLQEVEPEYVRTATAVVLDVLDEAIEELSGANQ